VRTRIGLAVLLKPCRIVDTGLIPILEVVEVVVAGIVGIRRHCLPWWLSKKICYRCAKITNYQIFKLSMVNHLLWVIK